MYLRWTWLKRSVTLEIIFEVDCFQINELLKNCYLLPPDCVIGFLWDTEYVHWGSLLFLPIVLKALESGSDISCHLDIPGEFSLGAVGADGLGEVSLCVTPGVGRGHLYGHHPCTVVTISSSCSSPIIKTLKVNLNFGFLVENVYLVCVGSLTSQSGYSCHCLLLKMLYLSLSFVIFHSSSRRASLSVFWNNSTNHLIILEEILFWRMGGRLLVRRVGDVRRG